LQFAFCIEATPEMKALVLAAGYGQRLRPKTEKLPKALIPMGGRAMIEYPLLLLRHYGIKEIVINLHHLGEMIEEYLEDWKKLGLQIIYYKEKKTARHRRRDFTG